MAPFVVVFVVQLLSDVQLFSVVYPGFFECFQIVVDHKQIELDHKEELMLLHCGAAENS